ncbi:uncharacterized protein F4822DRAFT_20592 [Hypoxylon trugodes]|uniref:uncharacterized protein n=1 Tax=Hypoxylon trugodes TaxID=326681 RepID=UPI00218FBA63|nr:uncharacterized protein F4822DRAFT_20592 [Hypoxylon trugodes]KAI1393679.1 hypothetical protein F4822DRAFT_20592 [Hypoxylon trugodes]
MLVGTHTDSVSTSSGINDNASGIAALLEVATQLAKFRTNSRIKFAFWTAAEPCLLGSKHWISNTHEEELRNIRLYFDVNMIGSPNGALKIYDGNGTTYKRPGPPGSGDAELVVAKGFETQGAPFKRTEISNRSDYAPFIDAHIPIAGLFSGANGIKTSDEAAMFGGEAGVPYDINYHKAEDEIQYINGTTLLLNTKALAYVIGIYGRSFEGFNAKSKAWRYVVTLEFLNWMALVWGIYIFFAYAL